MTFYLSLWLPKRYVARTCGIFFIAVPLTTVIGAPLSTSILQLGGAAGLRGWQWLFLIEGVPAILLAVAALFYLTDRPKDAAWLSEAQRNSLTRILGGEHASIERHTNRHTIGQALCNPRVLQLCVVYFCIVVGLYGVGFWIPQIVRQTGLTTMQTGYVAAIPYVFASLGCSLWGRHSDLKGERRWHLIGAATLAAVGLAASGTVGQPVVAIAALCVAAAGIYAVLPVFWSFPLSILTGSGAAAGIALINSVGNLGGFVGPYAVGWLKQATGGFEVPLLFLSGSMLIGALIVFACVRDPLRHKDSDAQRNVATN
nr:MFS transporter [Paraburkholderia sp. BL23I1N1]